MEFLRDGVRYSNSHQQRWNSEIGGRFSQCPCMMGLAWGPSWARGSMSSRTPSSSSCWSSSSSFSPGIRGGRGCRWGNLVAHNDDVVYDLFSDYSVIKWRHIPYCWPFVMGIHWLPMDSPYIGPVMRRFDVYFFVSLCKPVNKNQVVDLRRHDAHAPSLIGHVILQPLPGLLWSSWCYCDSYDMKSMGTRSFIDLQCVEIGIS